MTTWPGRLATWLTLALFDLIAYALNRMPQEAAPW